MIAQQVVDAPLHVGQYETIDGLELYVRRTHPDDPTVDLVCVHGLGGMSTNWTDLMHLQADRGRRCAAIDLPGFGRSPADPNGDYTLARHARAVIAFLETQPEPVHLLGNSLGGAISTTVAAVRPDLVRTLTLMAPALPHIKWGKEKLPIVLGLAPKAADLLAWAKGNQSPSERVDETLALVYGDIARIAPHRRAEAIAEGEARHGLPHVWDAFVNSARGLGFGFLPWHDAYLWRRLDQVQAPVLAVFGTKDRLVDSGIASRVARTIDNGTVVVLPGVGHVPQMELPVTIDRLVDAHIRGQL